MNDEELTTAWLALDPTRLQRRRIDGRVFAWIEANETSLAAEWLALFRQAPLPALGLVSVGAVWVIALTPVAWFARTLIGA